MIYLITRGSSGTDEEDLEIIGCCTDKDKAEQIAKMYHGTTDTSDLNGATITEFEDLAEKDIPERLLFRCETSEYYLENESEFCKVSSADTERELTTTVYYIKPNNKSHVRWINERYTQSPRAPIPNRHWSGTVWAKDGDEAREMFLKMVENWIKEHNEDIT